MDEITLLDEAEFALGHSNPFPNNTHEDCNAENTSEYPYLIPNALPTQIAVDGIRFDYNDGIRISVPRKNGTKWNITIKDENTGTIVYNESIEHGMVCSVKKYFVPFSLSISEILSNGSIKKIYSHKHDLSEEKTILIQLPVGTLGDVLAWFPYVVKFSEKHPCQIYCVLSENFIPLFEKAYPKIKFITKLRAEKEKISEIAYSIYNIGLFFKDEKCNHQPTDFRFVGLHKTAAYILGVDPDEERPKLVFDENTRPIKEPYVCIAVQSSAQCKYWNNPHGWASVINFLKQSGYRVICIDRDKVHGAGLVWNHIPFGVEDETGNRPLTERAQWLRHAEFFIGTSSGLAWLAWTVQCKVVMISGFTHPTNEFHTPWRVINWHACNSCWNDPKHQFDHNNFLWCPRHEGTQQQFECSRLISSDQVIKTIKDLMKNLPPI